MSVEELIIRRIKEKGPITFREFMEEALYGKRGYYTTMSVFEEDYITASRFADVFGEALSIAIADMLEKCGGDTVVEFGAGDGRIAYEIARRLDAHYIAVDRSEKMRRRAKERLRKLDNAEVVEAFDGKVRGVIFSNEFFDALPFHLVVKLKSSFREVYVDYSENRGFVEVLGELSTNELENYFRRLGVELDEGFRAEVCLDAVKYLRKFSEILDKGYVLTIDYGFPSEMLYVGERRDGTLVCYSKNAVSYNPYEDVGRKDITHHVNFSTLMEFGRDFGLETVGFTNQLYFLLSTLECRDDLIADFETASKFKYLAFRMGGFKVLVQGKGVETSGLRCLKYVPRFGFWSKYGSEYDLEMESDLTRSQGLESLK
jgi:SAM-dependent MidA family methyltransferase